MKSKQQSQIQKKLANTDAGFISSITFVNEISFDLTTPSQISRANQVDSGNTSPKMPHERDESVDMTGGIQSEKVKQAAKDIKNGLKDTSRAPEADAAYQKQK